MPGNIDCWRYVLSWIFPQRFDGNAYHQPQQLDFNISTDITKTFFDLIVLSPKSRYIFQNSK